MPRLARSDLEQLLQARKLGPALVAPSFEVAAPPDERTVCATGLAGLDVALGGGWPRGQVSEIVAPLSTGGTWVACTSMAAATRRGELAALVDPLDRFDPESAAAAGFVWPYLLWVRGRAPERSTADQKRTLEASRGAGGRRSSKGPGGCVAEVVAVERALKALALVLRAEGFGLVVLDMQGVRPAAIAPLAFTTWRRLHRMIEGRETTCLLLHHASLGRSAGGVTLRLESSAQDGGSWVGQGSRARRLVGLSGRGRVVRARDPGLLLDGFAWNTDDVRLPG